MEDNRNWQGWTALALASLALVIALFGRNTAPSVTITMPNGPTMSQVGPQPPDSQPARPSQPNGGPGWLEPQFGPRPQGQPSFGPGRDRGWRGSWDRHPEFGGPRGFEPGPWHHHMPFFAPFFLLFGLVRLAGVVLLVWLLIKFFQGRRDRPSGA